MTPPSIGSPGGGVGGGGELGPEANAASVTKNTIKTHKILIGTIFIGCKSK